MSVRKLDLRSPAVIAAVVVLLAAVVAVNVRTFGAKDRRRSQAQERVEQGACLPPDLAELVQQAGESRRDKAPQPAAQAGFALTTVRDPFVAAPAGGPAPAADPAQGAVRKARPTAGRPRACAAVMFSGPRPAALIDGQVCTVGQRVGDYEVMEISLSGVTVRDGSGRRIFLEVAEASGGSFLVTGGGDGAATGGTDGPELKERTQ